MRALIRLCLLVLCLALPGVLAAQEDEGSRLERLIEDTLSDGDNLQVSLTNFRGALSSTAELDRLTISDSEGVWLILENASLNWRRTQLVRGRLDVRELTAERLEILRPPLPGPDAGPDIPDAEATPFALPDLPVEIDIETFAIDRVVLGESVIGLAADLSIAGSAQLADGSGQAMVDINRLDGPRGEFTLDVAYTNETGVLALDVQLDEAEGGIVATLAGIPDTPAIALTLVGEGPLTEFEAELSLSTDGAPRLTGTIAVSEGPEPLDRVVTVDLGGDVRPLFEAEYRDFFGEDTSLAGRISLFGDGRVAVDELDLSTAELVLTGRVAVRADGLPDVIDIEGRVADAGGGPVRLPVPGDVFVDEADIAIVFDSKQGSSYRAAFEVAGFATDMAEIEALSLTALGTITEEDGGIGAVTSAITARTQGLAMTDPALGEALGPEQTISANLSWVEGAPLLFNALEIAAGDLGLTGTAALAVADGAADLTLDIAAEAGDLSRFAAVAEAPLEGALSGQLTGSADLLSGAFDLRLEGLGRDLRFVDAVPPELTAGETQLIVDAARDETGLTLDTLRLVNEALSVAASGRLDSENADLEAQLTLGDIGVFTDVVSGPVSADLQVDRSGGGPWQIAANMTAPVDSTLSIAARIDPDLADISAEAQVRVGDIGVVTDVVSGPVAADLQIDRSGGGPWQIAADMTAPGDSTLSIAARIDPDLADISAEAQVRVGDIGVVTDVVSGPVTADLSVERAGDGPIAVEADVTAPANSTIALSGTLSPDLENIDIDTRLRLGDIGIFTDVISGPVTGTVSVTRDGGNPFGIDADLLGPAGINLVVNGEAGLPDGAVDMRARGALPLQLANQFIAPRNLRGTLDFNVALRGQPNLSNLNGTLSATGARASLPTIGNAIEGISLDARINGGVVTADISGLLSTGGRLNVSTRADLGSPSLPVRAEVTGRELRLVDPTLYEVMVQSVDLTFDGRLRGASRLSGRIDIAEAEIRVPEGGIGTADIPPIDHINETAPQFRTRVAAGLGPEDADAVEGGGMASRIALDLTISAPSRVFIRGRGLDAELGGTIRLGGTVADVIPDGRIQLIRGRWSILGVRLDLDQGSVSLQGDFDPFIDLSAVSRAGEYTVRISLLGPLSEPTIALSSEPPLPEDEILAQLLFGRSVSALSPVQLLRLADTAAGLAGGSTDGGIFSSLRDGLGLDDLDVQTDETGGLEVRAGRYLSENVYSDVTIGADGETDLSLNIDLTEHITGRGTFSTDGESSLGIYYERDY